MTTAVKAKFQFTPEQVEPGDRFHLDHEGSQIVIVITGVDHRGIYGMGASRNGDWCGPWGRIIFYESIRLGEETAATFDQTAHVSQLKVIPTRLVRVRGTSCETLLG